MAKRSPALTGHESCGIHPAVIVSAATLVALLLVGLSMTSGDRPAHLEQSIGRGLAMLHGQEYVDGDYRFYMSMFQNRVMVPGAQALLIAIGVPSASAFFWVYLATAIAALACCWQVFFRLSEGRLGFSILCWLWLSFSIGLTFTEPWIQATEFLDLLFLAGMVLALSGKYYGRFLVLLFLGAFNRETVVYGAMLWCLVHGLRLGRPGIGVRDLMFSVGSGLLAYGLVLLIRYVLGGDKGLENFQTQTWYLNPWFVIRAVGDLWGQGQWLLRVVLMLAVPLLLALFSGAGRKPLGKAFVAMAFLVVYAICQYGVLYEIRLFLPAVLFLLCAASAFPQRISRV